jgi:hypothetical protein
LFGFLEPYGSTAIHNNITIGLIHHWFPVVSTAVTDTAIAACPSLQAITGSIAPVEVYMEPQPRTIMEAWSRPIMEAVVYSAIGDLDPGGS